MQKVPIPGIGRYKSEQDERDRQAKILEPHRVFPEQLNSHLNPSPPPPMFGGKKTEDEDHLVPYRVPRDKTNVVEHHGNLYDTTNMTENEMNSIFTKSAKVDIVKRINSLIARQKEIQAIDPLLPTKPKAKYPVPSPAPGPKPASQFAQRAGAVQLKRTQTNRNKANLIPKRVTEMVRRGNSVFPRTRIIWVKPEEPPEKEKTIDIYIPDDKFNSKTWPLHATSKYARQLKFLFKVKGEPKWVDHEKRENNITIRKVDKEQRLVSIYNSRSDKRENLAVFPESKNKSE
jgi:hypothetical protein